MRVGLVIYGDLNTLSGGYLYDRKLVEFLRGQGDQIEVISLPWRSYGRHLLDNLDQGLYQRLLAARVDVLLQDELNHPSLFAINYRLRERVDFPIISIVHHLRCAEQHPTWLLRLYSRVEKIYLQSVDGYVFNSQTTRRMVEQVCACSKADVVATPGGDALSGEAVHRTAYSRDGLVQILFVGNWIERKGLHRVIAALSKLQAYEWQFTIAGRIGVDKRYARRVLRQIEQSRLGARVKVLGAVSDDQLQYLWRSSHVLVVPSQYEGFGIVYLEAMRFGVVPVGGALGAAGEIIQDGENGLLVPPEDQDALLRGLERLIRDQQYRQQLSAAALARYCQFPSWKESMSRVRQFLLEQTRQGKP